MMSFLHARFAPVDTTWKRFFRRLCPVYMIPSMVLDYLQGSPCKVCMYMKLMYTACAQKNLNITL